MAKKQRRLDREKLLKPSGVNAPASAQSQKTPAAPAGEGESPAKARLLWSLAFVLIFFGYFSLTKADPGGRNSWSWISPAFLLAGYLLIIPAISVSYRD